MSGRPVALDAVFGDGEESERPELAELLHLRRHGACADMDPAVFFPARGQSAVPAKIICSTCPVRAECLAYAIEHREWFGIWGGTTEKERRPLNLLHADGVPIEEIVARTLAGEFEDAMASRRTRRIVPAGPYGWRRRAEGEGAIPVQAEQLILARLRRWVESGLSPAEAAGRLNAKGVPTRGGGEWVAGLVGRVLRDNGWRPKPATSERRAS